MEARPLVLTSGGGCWSNQYATTGMHSCFVSYYYRSQAFQTCFTIFTLCLPNIASEVYLSDGRFIPATSVVVVVLLSVDAVS